MKDIRQSDRFASFIQDLGWKIEKLDSAYIYLKKFPLLGFYAKIPRATFPYSFTKIHQIIKDKKIFQLKIAPFIPITDSKYHLFGKLLTDNNFKVDPDPFNPTTTYQINLALSEEKIFNNFSGAKRRAVRRALKNKIIVKESDNYDLFIKIRKNQYFPMGFLVAGEMQKLWNNFYPKNCTLLLAYNSLKDKQPIAGILLLFYDGVAYYWYASALALGKKLFAPSLLVWEALKISKKRRCNIFDFEGIYDERFPKASSSWKGFTKFKEGFGGEKVIFMENYKMSLPFIHH